MRRRLDFLLHYHQLRPHAVVAYGLSFVALQNEFLKIQSRRSVTAITEKKVPIFFTFISFFLLFFSIFFHFLRICMYVYIYGEECGGSDPRAQLLPYADVC